MIVPRATTIGILCLSVLVACDGGVRPYRRMGRAARSERNLAVQVDDHLLTEKIRSALADTEGFGEDYYRFSATLTRRMPAADGPRASPYNAGAMPELFQLCPGPATFAKIRPTVACSAGGQEKGHRRR